jgi:hypothetical protein
MLDTSQLAVLSSLFGIVLFLIVYGQHVLKGQGQQREKRQQGEEREQQEEEQRKRKVSERKLTRGSRKISNIMCRTFFMAPLD